MAEKVEVKFMAKPKRKRRSNASTSKTKKKFSFSKWLLLFVGLQLFGFLAIYVYLGNKAIISDSSNGIFVTAAHLSEEEVGPGYKLLYSDKERDTAYYLDLNHKRPTVSFQEVKVKDLTYAKVVESTEGEFVIEVKNPEEIYAGLSGERVYDSSGEKVIGFISALVGDGKIKCVAIN